MMSVHRKTYSINQSTKVAKAQKPGQPMPRSFDVRQLLEAPGALREGDVLAAQQQVGNMVVQRTLDNVIQRNGDDKVEKVKKKVRTTDKVYQSSVGSFSQESTAATFGLAGDYPLDEVAQQVGGVGGAMANIGLSGFGLPLDAYGIFEAHQKRKSSKTSPIGKQVAWKEQIDRTKGLAGKAMNIGSTAASFGGDLAGAVGGAALSGVEFVRNSYAASRASGQEIRLGAISDDLDAEIASITRRERHARRKRDKLKKELKKTGPSLDVQAKKALKSKIRRYNRKVQAAKRKLEDPNIKQKLEDAQQLRNVAEYAREKKSSKSNLKALGAMGAGFGVAGSIALLASNPAGWALAILGALVGTGIGVYKISRGAVKRSHRRSKLSAVEDAVGIRGEYKADMGKGRQAWNKFTGKDIDLRRKFLKENKEGWEAALHEKDELTKEKQHARRMRQKYQKKPKAGLDAKAKRELKDRIENYDQRVQSAKLSLANSADRFDEAEKNLRMLSLDSAYSRVMTTGKERMAKTLVKHLKGSAQSGQARKIGKVLGITDKQGRLVRNKGWSLKKEKLDFDQATNTHEEQEEAVELAARKLAGS